MSDAPSPKIDSPLANRRSAERIKVSDRAAAKTDSGRIIQGKMIDFSKSGMCVLMDESPPLRKIVSLDCHIVLNGERHLFQIHALIVYAALSRHHFKVGFQFEPNSPVAISIMKKITA